MDMRLFLALEYDIVYGLKLPEVRAAIMLTLCLQLELTGIRIGGPLMDEAIRLVAEIRQQFAELQKLMVDLTAENERLRAGKFTEQEFQNLCHNFSPDDVAGCTEYQRKLFGLRCCHVTCARPAKWVIGKTEETATYACDEHRTELTVDGDYVIAVAP